MHTNIKDDAFGRPTVSTCFKPLSLHRENFHPASRPLSTLAALWCPQSIDGIGRW